MDILRNLFFDQIIAALIFALTVVFALTWATFGKHRKKQVVTTLRILFVGTFFAAIAHYTPILYSMLQSQVNPTPWGDAIINAIQYTLKMFMLSADVTFVMSEEAMRTFSSPAVAQFAITLASIFYIVAPLFTFGFILSLFKNLTSRIKYRLCFFAHTHVFPEINEESVALAKDIKKNSRKLLFAIPRDIVVFGDASQSGSLVSNEVVCEAYDVADLVMQWDINSLKLKFGFSKRKVSIYLISGDENKKATLAKDIVREYDIDNVFLYLISGSLYSELLMGALHSMGESGKKRRITIMRNDPARSFVYNNLQKHGELLFERARDIDGEKVISAVLVGLGSYGTTMLKTLAWFCQVEGYTLKINAFDLDKDVENRLKAQCPELLSEKYNGVKTFGEPYYEINIHGGYDARGKKFIDKIKQIDDATYFLVCLGNDEANLEAAVNIRRATEGVAYPGGTKPDIETIIYNHETQKMIGIDWADNSTKDSPVGATNHRSQPYNVITSADVEEIYSVSCLINAEAVNNAFERHCEYALSSASGKTKEQVLAEAHNSFWGYEYNMRSSLAKALHVELLKKLGLYSPLSRDEVKRITNKQEAVALANQEHIRWSAYLRSEGFSWSGSYEPSSRNDLAKLHHNLVPTDKLDLDTLKKDL